MIVWAITILETFGLFLFAIIVIPRIVKIKIVSNKTKNEFESNEVKLQFQKQDANDGRTYFWLSTIGWFNGQAQYIFLSLFSQQLPLGVMMSLENLII